ncbi:hypothetical protein ACYULU_00285 [Breznakiellaceae bacterium SP9]
MDILINGIEADISIDTEKILGDVLAGLEPWLREQGCFLSGIEIDGVLLESEVLEAECARSIDGIATLNLRAFSWNELALQSFCETQKTAQELSSAGFAAKQTLCAEWENSPAARFLSEQIPDMFEIIKKCFAGEGIGLEALGTPIAERIREIQDTKTEILTIESFVSEIAVRMQDLPLDIQTGKDQHAAQTINFFSHCVEKLYRLLYLLRFTGLDKDKLELNWFKEFNSEFHAALKELLDAYQIKDAVLVGDLAEYELAPRLIKLYTALKGLL